MATARKKATPRRAKVARKTSPTQRKTLLQRKASLSRITLSKKSLIKLSSSRILLKENAKRLIVLKKTLACTVNIFAQYRVSPKTTRLAPQAETARMNIRNKAAATWRRGLVDTKVDSKKVVVLEKMLMNQLAAA